MFMKTTAAASLLCMLALAACDKRPSDPTMPRSEAVVRGATPTTSAAPDPSVPTAGAVVTAPATATAKDEAASRTSTMSPAQESSAMPMPGQVNNHSTTALDAPAKRAASAP